MKLYARPECHLCDEARIGLERLLADGASFELEEVNIDSDESLLRALLERIPVVEVDGEVVCELGFDVEGVKARLDTVSP